MASFRYTAKDEQGQTRSGRMEAADEQAARERFSADGLRVDYIERVRLPDPVG